MPSSRVNDGICDCCDGSDEWAEVSGSPCVNDCDEMGAAERVERERLAKVVEEGLKLKAEMAAKGTNTDEHFLTYFEARDLVLKIRTYSNLGLACLINVYTRLI